MPSSVPKPSSEGARAAYRKFTGAGRSAKERKRVFPLAARPNALAPAWQNVYGKFVLGHLRSDEQQTAAPGSTACKVASQLFSQPSKNVGDSKPEFLEPKP